jgi:hypothetical protein
MSVLAFAISTKNNNLHQVDKHIGLKHRRLQGNCSVAAFYRGNSANNLDFGSDAHGKPAAALPPNASRLLVGELDRFHGVRKTRWKSVLAKL